MSPKRLSRTAAAWARRAQLALVATASPTRPEFLAVAITPGQANGRTFPETALRASLRANLWHNVSCFVAHSPLPPGERPLDDVGAVFHSPAWDDHAGGIVGHLRPFGPKADLVAAVAREWLADRQAGQPVPNIGLSADLLFSTTDGQTVNKILRVLSVDVVFDPARGGAILRALNSLGVGGWGLGGREEGPATLSALSPIPHPPSPTKGDQPMPPDEPQPTAAGGVLHPQSSPASAGQVTGTSEVPVTSSDPPQHSALSTQHFLRAQCAYLLESALAAAGDLPPAIHTALRAQFANQIYLPQALHTAIEGHRALVRELRGTPAVTGNGPVPAQQPSPQSSGKDTASRVLSPIRTWTDADRLQLAIQRDVFRSRLPAGSPHVPRLSGLRELYLICTGDTEFTGQLHPERAQLSAITTSTMAGLVTNALNKVVLEQWAALQAAGYMWWEGLVHEQDFASVQDVDWVSVGGIANLPEVAESETYDELAWDDVKENQAWNVKGGIIVLTWQMIDRDQTQKIAVLPNLLANAGRRTLSALVSDIFTSNSGVGPTLDQDATALFHANHGGNVSTNTLSYDNWITAHQVMFKQTEINSAKRMGLRPRFLLVPIEKEEIAHAIARTPNKPDTANYHANQSLLRPEDIRVVPDWTDAYKWAAVADPLLYPCLGVGYRFGRVPQVVEEVPNTGGNFTNRTTRFRVDFVVNVGVIDYRGLYKSNATS